MSKKALKALAGILASLLLCAVCAAAADMDYTGPVDPFTGDPAASSASGGTTDETEISSGVYYSTSAREFTIYCGGESGGAVTSNIVGDMVTTGAVHFAGDPLNDAALYLDGEELTDVDYTNISAPGKYILKFGNDDNASSFNIPFTIVSELTGALSGYTMPTGFSIEDATLDGETASFTDSYISMETEGEYSISYLCNATKQGYSLQVTVDHTPPVLALSNVQDGKASGPVSLEDAEDGATLEITLDGKTISPSRVLKSRGQYTVKITDAAGNSTDYQFLILTYFNSNSFMFIGLFLAGIGTLAAYLWHEKTHLRTR